MVKSIFDRDVFFKMEEMGNPFAAARALSKRAREVNSKQRENETEGSVSAPAVALEDFVEGRIRLVAADESRALGE